MSDGENQSELEILPVLVRTKEIGKIDTTDGSRSTLEDMSRKSAIAKE